MAVIKKGVVKVTITVMKEAANGLQCHEVKMKTTSKGSWFLETEVNT
jgi:hypothetical protein